LLLPQVDGWHSTHRYQKRTSVRTNVSEWRRDIDRKEANDALTQEPRNEVDPKSLLNNTRSLWIDAKHHLTVAHEVTNVGHDRDALAHRPRSFSGPQGGVTWSLWPIAVISKATRSSSASQAVRKLPQAPSGRKRPSEAAKSRLPPVAQPRLQRHSKAPITSRSFGWRRSLVRDPPLNKGRPPARLVMLPWASCLHSLHWVLRSP